MLTRGYGVSRPMTESHVSYAAVATMTSIGDQDHNFAVCRQLAQVNSSTAAGTLLKQ